MREVSKKKRFRKVARRKERERERAEQIDRHRVRECYMAGREESQ